MIDRDKSFLDWVRKNWFTVLGIIIILSITWYDLETVQEQKKEAAVTAAENCNDYWREQIKEYCPRLSGGNIETTTVGFNWSIT